MAKYEPKTKQNDADVIQYLHTIENEQRKKDSLILVDIMEKVTGEKPKMWGESIIGYGTYSYEGKTCKGEWLASGFSPRKASLVVYIMPGFSPYQDLLNKLGKHTHTKSCLHIKKLEDIDIEVLKTLIKKSYNDIKQKYS